MRVLKASERAVVRKTLWLAQGKKCAITGIPIKFEDTVLDHIHNKGAGLVRGAVGRGANRAEGVALQVVKWMKGIDNPNEALNLVIKYWNTTRHGSPHLEEPIDYGKVPVKRRKRKTK